jgi:hypothetical protein
MKSKYKIFSKNQILWATSTTVVLVSLAAGYMLGYKTSMSAFYSVVGIFMSYSSVIVAAFVIIAPDNYSVRLLELVVEDTSQRQERDFGNLNVSTDEEKDTIKNNFETQQKPLNKEIDHMIQFDDVAKAHVKLSIAIVALGAAFQVAGAI